ncbi:hypothetical protein [Tranquillimonas rosea]|nr:hypothetical protein [Tranquillimonas rosea]
MSRQTEPEYTHWQILLLRDALEAYRRFTPDEETGRRPLSWNALRERVAVYTDVEFGKDDLRQFVEGKKQGHANFRVPQAHRLRAIFDFLSDENIAILTPEELDQANFVGVHAPLHLARYLVSLSTPDPVAFPRSLVGQYDTIARTDGSVVEKHMQISFDGRGFASVDETHEFYHVNLPSGELTEGRLKRKISLRRRPDARIRHNGWALVTPEDNLLMFMKSADTRENHFWKLAVEHSIWEGEPVTDLLLNKFDWPLFLEKEATTGEAVGLSAKNAASNTWHFTRRGDL